MRLLFFFEASAESNAEPPHLILTTVNNMPQEGCCMHVKIPGQ